MITVKLRSIGVTELGYGQLSENKSSQINFHLYRSNRSGDAVTTIRVFSQTRFRTTASLSCAQNHHSCTLLNPCGAKTVRKGVCEKTLMLSHCAYILITLYIVILPTSVYHHSYCFALIRQFNGPTNPMILTRQTLMVPLN